jgi:hypothetical protein
VPPREAGDGVPADPAVEAMVGKIAEQILKQLKA